MKHLLSLAALTSALLTPAAAFADDAQTLSIKNFIGTISVTIGETFAVTGDKGSITEIRQGGLIIDGNETVDDSRCKNVNGNVELSFGKKSWFKRIGGYKNLEDYPNLDIVTPKGAHLYIRESVIFGTGQDFGAVDANIQSCGDLEIGNITGPLTLEVSGSGDFRAQNVGKANVRISGSGDVTLGDMEMSVLKVSGSGDLEAETITGAAIITTTGSGDIEIETLNGALVYEGRGSSDFDLGEIDGRISITVSGSGDVDIDSGNAPIFMVTSRGSSNVTFGGTAGDVTIAASGSGNVEVDDATGNREVKSSGSASVKIGDTRYDN